LVEPAALPRDASDHSDDRHIVTARERHRRDASTTLARLGGTPRFAEGLPFARPARPRLERVMRRVAPSYEAGMPTNGPLVAELEERIADRLGVAHIVGVSSCTSGLILTLQAVTNARVGPVVLPSFTFAASGHAVLWNHRAPRFVECDAATFQIDLEHTTDHLAGAAALMATHVFGAPCEPAAVEQRARAAGVPVVFDAAHALGALTNGCPVGGHGDAEVFSLTPTKSLVAGEGGLVATNDTGLAETLRIGRDYGNPGDYDTRFAGLNARMSEMHAAVALESLEIFDETLERRRDLAATYMKYLDAIPGLSFQAVSPGDTSNFKDITITIDASRFGLTRDQLVGVLAAEGIDTRTYFDPPVHRQQAYRDMEMAHLPITDAVAGSVVSLPIYPNLDEHAVELVADAVFAAHVHAEEIDGQWSERPATKGPVLSI
jgi:dTDP-4-amino-4,6-dideoxygalactose transaminase